MSYPRSSRRTPPPWSRGQHASGRQNDDWRSWDALKVIVHDLPNNTTTVLVHRLLKQYGNVSRILILEDRHGGHPTTAEVFFKPPPHTPLWVKPLDIRTSNNDTHQVRITLADSQRRKYTMPANDRGIEYPEEILLQGSALGFGVLGKSNEVLVKQVVSMNSESVPGSPPGSVHLTLNLRRREIFVNFPIRLDSTNGARTRLYRFPVAFDDKFKIWRLHDKNNNVQSYLIHLRNPPWFSRRLDTAVGSSHVPDAKKWNEDDLWTRQTDIVRHKNHFTDINQTSISLKKDLNRIDVARWRTFKFDIDESEVDGVRAKLFDEALKDHNIRVGTVTSDYNIREELSGGTAAYWEDIEFDGDGLDPLDDGCTLPFELRYQLEVCLANGRLSEYAIDKAFLRKLKSLNTTRAQQMLIHVDSIGEEIQDPMSIFDDIRFQRPVRNRRLPGHCYMSYNATITATAIKINTPTVDVSNRVVRKYMSCADRFLRVSIEDDEYRGQSKIYAGSNAKMNLVIDRVRRALTNGISIAGRHYEFLAYGNSQLRDRGAYFFASTPELTADMIRAEMGVFDNERIVAKRAARMGQCFSTTRPIRCSIPLITENDLTPDIEINGHNFTDGVGKISKLAATLVADNMDLPPGEDPPSCFQFRLGGCKGVLAIDPSLQRGEVRLRRSQFKFQSNSKELEIIRCSQFWQPFLNRQIIIVLSNLGVKDQVFQLMQQATIDSLNNAMKDDEAALQALRTNVDPNGATLSMYELVSSGFRRAQEPFVMSLMGLWRAWTLLGLKERARIPVKDGAFILGVVDETNTLRGHYDRKHAGQGPLIVDREQEIRQLPQIFLQIKDPITRVKKVVEGICILARNPSLHQGDIRVVQAVDVKALHHLVDVVVMPQNGDRDLPSMCSGGDLDGDDYLVTWDSALIPEVWNVTPHHYEPPAPKMAQGEITTRDIIDFYVDYIQNDSLGRIAHAHLGNADYFDDGIFSDQCQQLVQLHSVSVDYPKTGVPAKLPLQLEPTAWPHFMEKRGRWQYSRKILGQLYDAVEKLVAGFDLRARGVPKFDARVLNLDRPDRDVFNQVQAIKHEYDMAMRRIMAQHKIKTEFEIWSTFVMSHSKKSTDYKFHEEIGQISKSLKEEFRKELVDAAGGDSFSTLMPFAIAAYQFTAEQVTTALQQGESLNGSEVGKAGRDDEEQEPELPKVPFCSFPWLLQDVLCKIASSTPFEEAQPSAVSARKEGQKPATGDDSNEATNSRMQPAPRRDSMSHAHNAELRRPSDRSNHSSSDPDPFAKLDPLSRRNSHRTGSTSSSDRVKKGTSIKGENGVAKLSKMVPGTDQEAFDVEKGTPKAIHTPKRRASGTAGVIDLLGSPSSAEKRPVFKSDIFKSPLRAIKTPSSPADWKEYARNGSSTPYGKVTKESSLSADDPYSTPRPLKTDGLKPTSGNIYNTQDYGRKDVARDRPSSSGSEAYSSGQNSQHDESSGVSPVDGGFSLAAAFETVAASSTKRPSVASRPARLMGDPANMTDEEKAAILAEDFD
ncbi:RNA-dependent RNA polymerase 1 [Cyphellophora attinorum]|uniref:RNA-directed RNA polymerase n=1 Tax=Cyphellophora attinorum TaxID=1664694 RepID=A0A0N1H2G1_9EURO|nr:RNA-dependent RNA polymerase 1 [Phialophora attinorum]KPI35395.1 RNA-dependent RNA polymerase 1 [Phialophora attinorum]